MTFTSKRVLPLALASTFILATTGCLHDDDHGDDHGHSAVELSATNAKLVAAHVANNLHPGVISFLSFEISSLSDNVVGVVAATSPTANVYTLDDSTNACTTGTSNITFTDTDASGTWTAGDTFEVANAACVDSFGDTEDDTYLFTYVAADDFTLKISNSDGEGGTVSYKVDSTANTTTIATSAFVESETHMMTMDDGTTMEHMMMTTLSMSMTHNGTDNSITGTGTLKSDWIGGEVTASFGTGATYNATTGDFDGTIEVSGGHETAMTITVSSSVDTTVTIGAETLTMTAMEEDNYVDCGKDTCMAM